MEKIVKIEMIPRELGGLGFGFLLDTNRINSRGKLDEMNRLERWRKMGIIEIFSSEVMNREASMGRNPARIEKAHRYVFVGAKDEIRADERIWRRVEYTLFPAGADNDNKKNDVAMCCFAEKYQAILVTNDGASRRQPGGILGRDELAKIGIQVMRDKEAVRLVTQKIRERDAIARELIAMGAPQPYWLDQDY